MLTKTILLTLKSLLKHYPIPDNQLEVCAKEIVKLLPKKHRERLIPDNRNVIPPALEEVIAYCKARCTGVDAVKWFNHYTAKGWKVGKEKMVDWQAAVRTWEPSEGNNGADSKAVKPLDTRPKLVQGKSGWRRIYPDGREEDCQAPAGGTQGKEKQPVTERVDTGTGVT